MVVVVVQQVYMRSGGGEIVVWYKMRLVDQLRLVPPPKRAGGPGTTDLGVAE